VLFVGKENAPGRAEGEPGPERNRGGQQEKEGRAAGRDLPAPHKEKQENRCDDERQSFDFGGRGSREEEAGEKLSSARRCGVSDEKRQAERFENPEPGLGIAR